MIEPAYDRRQEPRFNTSGTYKLEFSGAHNRSGKIYELSLNGALLERPSDFFWGPGERHCITLNFLGQPSFTAEALVVHVSNDRVGVEFYDMAPQSFTTLSQLIDNLLRVK